MGREQKERTGEFQWGSSSPQSGGGRERRRFEWLSQMCEDLPDRLRFRDERDQPDVAATRWALERKLVPHSLDYEMPSVYFSHKLIFDDGDQRVELIFFGHAHTAGDAVAWLPKHKILFSGDACVNGAFNYTGDADTASWIAVLGAMEDLGVKTLCPGHGEMGGAEVIATQKRWFSDLRSQIKAAIDRGESLDTIKETLDIPFFEEWTGEEARSRTENIEHVFEELSAPAKSARTRRPHQHPHPHGNDLGLTRPAAPTRSRLPQESAARVRS